MSDSDKETDQEKGQDNEEQGSSSESENEESDEAGEDTQIHSDTETDVGLKSLLEDPSTEKSCDNKVIIDNIF